MKLPINMTRPYTLAVTALLAAVAYGPAMGQSSMSADRSKPAMNTDNKQTLPQELKQKLEKQGFTEVDVVPGSFLVSAKDKDGDPVTMVIGPHSLTMFTVTSSTAESKSTTGAGSSGK